MQWRWSRVFRFVFAFLVALVACVTNQLEVNADDDWGAKVGRPCKTTDFENKTFKRFYYSQSLYPPIPVEGQDFPFYYIAFEAGRVATEGFLHEPSDPVNQMRSILNSNAAMPYSLRVNGVLTIQVTSTVKHILECRVVLKSEGDRKAGDLGFERDRELHVRNSGESVLDIIAQFYRQVQ